MFMKNLLTKTHITIFAALISLLALGLNVGEFIDYDAAHTIADPALVILFVSFLFFLLRDAIFYSWLRFLAWWIPLGYFIVFIFKSPVRAILRIEFFNAQLMSLVLLFMSLALIVIKTWEIQSAEQQNPVNSSLKIASYALSFIVSVAISFYIYGFFW